MAYPRYRFNHLSLLVRETPELGHWRIQWIDPIDFFGHSRRNVSGCWFYRCVLIWGDINLGRKSGCGTLLDLVRDILRHFGCFSFTGSSNFVLYLLTKSLSFFSSTIGLFPRAALTCSSLSLVSTAKCHMCMCELYLVRLHFVLGICFLFWQSVRINQKRDLYYPCFLHMGLSKFRTYVLYPSE